MLIDPQSSDREAELIEEQAQAEWPQKLWSGRSALLVLAMTAAGLFTVSITQTLVFVQANMGLPAFIEAVQQRQPVEFTETPFTATLVTILGFGLVILVSLVAGGLSRRFSLADFGLNRIDRRAARNAVLFGLLLAVGRMLALIPLISSMPGLEQGSETLLDMAFNFESPLTILGSIALVSLIAPIYEEAFFRGFLHRWLRTHLTLWPSAVISSAVFAVFHLIPAQMLAAFIFGLGLAWYYEKTRSLWTVIIAHAFNNLLAQALTYCALAVLSTAT